MELSTFKLTLETLSNTSNFTTGNDTRAQRSEDPFQAVVMVITVLVTGSLSLITITGNILVLLSIIINRNLQTINNYFFFSLACADLMIGLNSMNLGTVDIVLGYWPLGPVVCDLCLVLDYAITWVSVLNLLIISFDRYFCVTKPLSYPARRTTRIAGMMIATAWVLSFLTWAPPILFWQFIVGERTVPEGHCYVQFVYNATTSFMISIVFFFLPAPILSVLYWKISRASKSRVKKGRQEPKQDNLSSSKAGDHITMPCHDNSVKSHCAQWSQNSRTDGVRKDEVSPPLHHERNEITEAPAGYAGNPTADGQNATMSKQQPKKRALPSREKRVTRTVMAILVAFVVLWTPYSIMVLINVFCSACLSLSMWRFGYWLYCINSTINPACYALCNVTFKKTFKQLLLCQHKDIRLGR